VNAWSTRLHDPSLFLGIKHPPYSVMNKLIILKVYSPTWVFAKVVTEIDGLQGLSCDVAAGYVETTEQKAEGEVLEVPSNVTVTAKAITKTFDDGTTKELSRLQFVVA